ncbi:MAG: formyltransferase family protein, partial [Thermoanaerobaculia bacterium]
MRTLLICHAEDTLAREGLARWLGSVSTLAGIVELREGRRHAWRRIRRELRRVGPARFLDVLAFRAYYRAVLGPRDRRWLERRMVELRERYPPVLPPSRVPVLATDSPNSRHAEGFLRERAPDLVLAVCKRLLAERIFSVPASGTWVLHPGICPEYRNAHGCFWALAHRDLEKVGTTLLRIDRGVDTGPVYGYFGCDYDEVAESHVRIQRRALLDNLDGIAGTLTAAHENRIRPLDTTGRPSAAWGQPWLSRHLRWKLHARLRLRSCWCTGRSASGRRRPPTPVADGGEPEPARAYPPKQSSSGSPP